MKERQQNSNASCKGEYNIPRRLTVFSVDSWRMHLIYLTFYLYLSFVYNSRKNLITLSTNQRSLTRSHTNLHHQYGILEPNHRRPWMQRAGTDSCIHRLICNITRTGSVGSLLSYAFILFVQNLKHRTYNTSEQQWLLLLPQQTVNQILLTLTQQQPIINGN